MENDNITVAHNITISLTSSEVYKMFLVEKYNIIVLYIPVILMAITANTLVILVVIKYNFMRSVTNYFLVNLSIADLLVTLVCMPNAMWNSYSDLWIFGELSCKIARYLQCICVASSVFTITAMALDRYLAITRPFGFLSRCFNKRMAILVIACLWFFALILFIPVLTVLELQTELIPLPAENMTNMTIEFCKEQWDSSYFPQHIFGIVCFTTMFALPGFLILWAYSMMGKKLCSMAPPFDNNEGLSSTQQGTRLVKERRRVAVILLLLAFVFFACWLPYNIIILLLDTKLASNTEILPYMLLLGHFNSALNPIIYCAMSRNFRVSVKHLMESTFRAFRVKNRRRQFQWMDSSRSSQHHFVERLKCVPINNTAIQNQQEQQQQPPCHFHLSPFQSSQKTTKTCAV